MVVLSLCVEWSADGGRGEADDKRQSITQSINQSNQSLSSPSTHLNSLCAFTYLRSIHVYIYIYDTAVVWHAELFLLLLLLLEMTPFLLWDYLSFLLTIQLLLIHAIHRHLPYVVTYYLSLIYVSST